jgi:hypothetical protein
MKTIFLALVIALLASVSSAQTVTSMTTQVNVGGSGFASGDTVTAAPSGALCTNVTIASPTLLTADCPNGTTSVTVKAAAPLYPYVLVPVPASLAFNWTLGTTVPIAQTVNIHDTSNCAVDNPCVFAATVVSDSSWLKVTPASGTTAFNISVSINTSGLAAGTYNGNIIATAKQFATPTLPIPVKLIVTAAAGHKVSLQWNASTLPTGAPAVTGYVVSRGTSTSGPWTQIATTTILQYTDSAVSAGQNPCYTVQGQNSNGLSLDATPFCTPIP